MLYKFISSSGVERYSALIAFANLDPEENCNVSHFWIKRCQLFGAPRCDRRSMVMTWEKWSQLTLSWNVGFSLLLRNSWFVGLWCNEPLWNYSRWCSGHVHQNHRKVLGSECQAWFNSGRTLSSACWSYQSWSRTILMMRSHPVI